MRAAHTHPPLLGALAALSAIAFATPPQTYLVCNYDGLCTAWPQNAGYRVEHRVPRSCGITSGLPKPQQLTTMQLLGKKGAEAMTKVYCDSVYDMAEPKWHGKRRVARQTSMPLRGRYRGQTQSQYLAIERGASDEGKAEAHSAADSSRASVSGNSGMGQAQSQSMYDPSCDDCYGRGGAENGNKGPYGLNINNNNGFGPSRTDGQNWAGPGGISSPTGNNPNGGSRLGSYGPSQPGTQGYPYYGAPGSSNSFSPAGITGMGPNRNLNYPSGQGGTSLGSGPGQDGSRGPLSPGSQLPTGSLLPGQGPAVTGYGPRQQGYGGYTPNQVRPQHNDNLGNRYGPSQNGVPGNYGPSMSGSPGGESYAPGSLINPPGRGLRPVQSGFGTNGESQPNQNGLPGNYNQMKPFGSGYPTGGDLIPGNYKPGPNGVFTPGISGSIPNSNSRDTVSNGQGPHGGVYSPGQGNIPSGQGGVISPQGNINTNQGTAPGRDYNPNQIGNKNILDRPQGGNWPLANYSPGNSPYFCCVVGPDGNLIPAGGAPYNRAQGLNNQYPAINSQYGQGTPVASYGPGSNGQQNGPAYGPGQNNLIHGQQEGVPYRQGIPNGNNNYGPPANMALPPRNGVNYIPGGVAPGGDGNYLNPNLGSESGSGYLPGQNGGGSPGRDGSYLGGGNSAPGPVNYTPTQGGSGNVGQNVPGNIAPSNIGPVNGPGQAIAPNTEGGYGTVRYPGKNIDGTYSPGQSTITGGYTPAQGGNIGGSYNPQQSGTPGSKIGYGTNPQGGLGGIGNYNLGQNPSGGNGNYLPGQTSGQGGSPNYAHNGYGPSASYLPGQRPGGNNFGSGPLGTDTIQHQRPGSNIYGTNPVGEPSNIQSYGPGTNVNPTGTGYGPSQNGNINGPGSGNLGPGNNGLGNVGGYNPSQGPGAGGNGIYMPGQNGMGQPGSYTPGIGGRQNIYGTDINGGYGGGPNENAYDQRFTGQNKENNGIPQNFTDPNAITDGDDSEAQASVSQAVNGTTASASSRGGNDKGRAQTNVHGTYTGSGSFSAQAQITGENKEAESEVSGGKKGASSSAQGSGRNNKSQANVQLGSETGSIQTQSLTNGAYHSSNSQVQGSIKGGMADAQARGPGSTSSQAQIGFTPYKEGDKAHDLQKIPFVGGGVASAQSSGRSGQSQSQLHGTFKYGISYNGAAQAGGSVDKDAVFPNRLSFDKIDVFDENNKNINVETEKPTAVDQTPVDPVPPLESVPSEEVLPTAEDVPHLSNLLPVEPESENEKKDEETLKNSESRYSSHTHLDHHKTSVQAPPPAGVGGTTRSFQPNYGNNGPEYEFTTEREDVQPDEYDSEGTEVEQGEYSNYDEIPRETLTHQSLQSPRKPLEVKQTTGGNTQHILLGSLENHDAEITQRNSERPDESKTYQPGERVPGTGGYTIPAGFTGSVKSVASKENTYVVGSKDSPSQAQTVTLTPGTGRVRYSGGRPVGAGQLRSLQPRLRDDRYVSVSKSVARDLDAEDHVRKQYSHSYYTKSSSCGFFTFTCTMVSSAEGKKKICRPKIPTNPDGTPIRC